MISVKWPEEVWLHIDTFSVTGDQVVHEEGQPLPGNMAKSSRTIRREALEFWALTERLNMEFYQQPSGFGDGVICAWKVEHQAKSAPMQHQSGGQLPMRAQQGGERD